MDDYVREMHTRSGLLAQIQADKRAVVLKAVSAGGSLLIGRLITRELVLKMLYDPRVKPGMNEKTALPVLKAIAAEYERDGLFATADSDAAKNGLARLMP